MEPPRRKERGSTYEFIEEKREKEKRDHLSTQKGMKK